jgi:hypothetical protein
LSTEAFAAAPALLGRRDPPYGIEAAAAAVSAGLGKGTDAPPAGAERTELLVRARSWLSQDLTACEELQTTPEEPTIAERVLAWKANATLRALLDDPEWKPLWERCDALLRATSRPASKPTR